MRRGTLRVALLALVSVSSASAQAPNCPWVGPQEYVANRGSPGDSVFVPLGEAAAKICYSRPAARGRPVMGNLIPYGRIWRTGANEPTILFLPVRAELAGIPLEAGVYLLMSIPEPEEWSVVVYTTGSMNVAEMFTTMRQVGLGRVSVEQTDKHIEQFTMSRGDGAAGGLVWAWERTRIRIPFEIRD